MPTIAAQCVLPMGSGLPSDVITNTFHFTIPTGDADIHLDALADDLSTFYQDCHKGEGGYANWINWGAAEVRFYLLELPPPRVPNIRPLLFPGITVSPTSIPPEVAIVCSFQADQVSGQTQARRRGRVYLGGFVNVCVSSSQQTPPRVNTTLVGEIRQAALTLRNAADSEGREWVVYSPTGGSSAPVTNGWVDNEPDTQRRRGVPATLRSSWP